MASLTTEGFIQRHYNRDQFIQAFRHVAPNRSGSLLELLHVAIWLHKNDVNAVTDSKLLYHNWHFNMTINIGH